MEYPNWFACYADDFFARHLSHLAGQPNLSFLQIGAFTGDASVWLLENVLTGEGSLLTDVDTWKGSTEPEHEPFDWTDVENTYVWKTRQAAEHPGQISRHISTSAKFWRSRVPGQPRFDFIYIDGSHLSPDVLSDAVHAFDWLVKGGLLAFDDYQWKPYGGAPPWECPALAIDAFTMCYQDRLNILEAGLQVWVQKK